MQPLRHKHVRVYADRDRGWASGCAGPHLKVVGGEVDGLSQRQLCEPDPKVAEAQALSLVRVEHLPLSVSARVSVPALAMVVVVMISVMMMVIASVIHRLPHQRPYE
eukprot:1748166-Rhodomonas_salina.4